MKAKLKTTCKNCESEINPGDTIYKINEKYWCNNEKCPDKGGESTKTTQTKKVSMSANIENPNEVKIKGPFDESEIIIRWASDRAYKLIYEGVTDINALSRDQLYSNGQREGMLTKLLVDTTLELMKLNGIKSSYHVS